MSCFKLLRSLAFAGLLSLGNQGLACGLGGNVTVVDAAASVCLDVSETLTSLTPDQIDGLLDNSKSTISKGIRHQLQNSYKDNIRTNTQQGKSFENKAVSTRARTKEYVKHSKAQTGQRLSQVKISQTGPGVGGAPLSEYEKALLKPAECNVNPVNGTVQDLPEDLKISFAQKNSSRLAEYSDLLIENEGVSDFCKGQLRAITTPDKVFEPRSVRPSLPESPLSRHRFQTSLDTAEGKLVRQVSNKFQLEWLERDGFRYAERHEAAAYLTGVALLQSADSAFVQGAVKQGYNYARSSEMLLDISRGLWDGVVEDGLTALVQAVPVLAEAGLKTSFNLARAQVDPAFAREYLPELANQVITAVPEVISQIYTDLVKDYDTAVNGDSYSRSRLLGRVAFDVALDYLTAGSTRVLNKGSAIATKSVRRSAGSHLKDLARDVLGDSAYYDGIRGKALNPRITPERIERKARRFQRIHREMNTRGISMSEKGQDYLTNLVANNGRNGLPLFSDEDLVGLMDQYQSLETSLGALQISGFRGDVHRMIPKQIELKSGDLLDLSPEKIFELHPGSIMANGRASMPGRMALYTMIGKDFSDIKDTLIKEVRATDADKYWKGSTFVESENILDLAPDSKAGAANLKTLKLTTEDLVKADDMLLPQAIGHLLDETDIEGVILPSRHNPKVNNLIIF